MRKLIGLLAVVGAAASVNAQVVITGDATFAPVNANIMTNGNTNTTPEAWSFVTFCANEGDTISVRVHRLVDALDPISSVVFGDMAGTAFAPASIGDDPLLGFSVIGLGDDENGPFTGGGPFGDPQIDFVATMTGTYTVVTSSFASDGIPSTGYLHQVEVLGSSCIPGPASAGLVCLAGLFAARRRRA